MGGAKDIITEDKLVVNTSYTVKYKHQVKKQYLGTYTGMHQTAAGMFHIFKGEGEERHDFFVGSFNKRGDIFEEGNTEQAGGRKSRLKRKNRTRNTRKTKKTQQSRRSRH